MTDEQEPDAATRAARRAWIVANHPDRGGDPQAFEEGLRRFTPAAGGDRPRPTVRRSRSPLRRVQRLVKQVQRSRRGQPRRHLD